MKILSIESSCDETAAAITEDGRKVISSVIATQIDEQAVRRSSTRNSFTQTLREYNRSMCRGS
jgi:tRNA A37 threonylcarbamoyltransferase TsaD